MCAPHRFVGDCLIYPLGYAPSVWLGYGSSAIAASGVATNGCPGRIARESRRYAPSASRRIGTGLAERSRPSSPRSGLPKVVQPTLESPKLSTRATIRRRSVQPSAWDDCLRDSNRRLPPCVASLAKVSIRNSGVPADRVLISSENPTFVHHPHELPPALHRSGAATGVVSDEPLLNLPKGHRDHLTFREQRREVV